MIGQLTTELLYMGQDPDDIPLRHGLTYMDYSEDLWEHRKAIITEALSEAFS